MKIQNFAVYLRHIRLPKDDHIPILLCFDIKALIVFKGQEDGENDKRTKKPRSVRAFSIDFWAKKGPALTS